MDPPQRWCNAANDQSRLKRIEGRICQVVTFAVMACPQSQKPWNYVEKNKKHEIDSGSLLEAREVRLSGSWHVGTVTDTVGKAI